MRLPEIGLAGMIFLSVFGLIGGILMGTHQEWWLQVVAIAAMYVAIDKSGLELGALAYLFPLILFVIGCVIGDISWFYQTGGIEIHLPDLGNPFRVN